MSGEAQTVDGDPICAVCGKRIRKGEGRFRPGLISVHVDCYTEWKERQKR
jgi:hypothetical protein